MNLRDTAKAAAEEWEIGVAESSVPEDGMAYSRPCQLRLADDASLDVERFHTALDGHGYAALDANPTHDKAPNYYDGEVCSREHYHRIRVLVFRGGMVRLYPKDDYEPAPSELQRLLEAIVAGWQADVEHDPMGREVTDS